jgi:hypothetical protein
MRTAAAVFGGMALVAAMAASADDQDQGSKRALKGNYAASGIGNCVSSNATFSSFYTPPAGFTPTLVPIGHASSNSFSFNGVFSFNKDGTGNIAARVVSVGDPDPGDSGATSGINTSSAFTYTLADDGTLTIFQGPSTSDFVVGPRAGGLQSVASGFPPMIGHVSTNKSTLVFGQYDPGVETLTRMDPFFGLVAESQRICNRAFTAIRTDSDQ